MINRYIDSIYNLFCHFLFFLRGVDAHQEAFAAIKSDKTLRLLTIRLYLPFYCFLHVDVRTCTIYIIPIKLWLLIFGGTIRIKVQLNELLGGVCAAAYSFYCVIRRSASPPNQVCMLNLKTNDPVDPKAGSC